MLIERACSLANDIANLRERSENVGRGQALKSAAEKLAERQSELSKLDQWANTLSSRGVTMIASGPSRTMAHAALISYREKFEASRASAADPAAISQLASALRNAAAEQRAIVSTGWQEYLRLHAPALNLEVLRVLRDIPSLRVGASKLERCLKKLDGWRQALPEEASALKEFDEAVEDARRTWQQLGGNDLRPDVAEFLAATASGQAALEMLTPPIVEWLKKHQIWGAFRITLARDPVAPQYR